MLYHVDRKRRKRSFENDVINFIENIKFRNAENQFQISLAIDLKKINFSPNILVFADKTRNIYETSLDTNTDQNAPFRNDELKHISNNLGIGDQIEQMKKREAFISLKDRKENFENNSKMLTD